MGKKRRKKLWALVFADPAVTILSDWHHYPFGFKAQPCRPLRAVRSSMYAANPSIPMQVGRAWLWHIACTYTSERKIKSTVVGCGERNARKISGCATSIILEPEEDL